MIGAHVVKRGLSPLLIDLMQKGIITHIACNGATTIHDFEIAMLGHTSEDVASGLEDGSFGMAEETGAYMNQAIQQGYQDGIGLGEALGKWISDHPAFTNRQNSLVYQSYCFGVPLSVHVAIGTDIIHQHPDCDFAATGWTSGLDFKIFCASVSQAGRRRFLQLWVRSYWTGSIPQSVIHRPEPGLLCARIYNR